MEIQFQKLSKLQLKCAASSPSIIGQKIDKYNCVLNNIDCPRYDVSAWALWQLTGHSIHSLRKTDVPLIFFLHLGKWTNFNNCKILKHNLPSSMILFSFGAIGQVCQEIFWLWVKREGKRSANWNGRIEKNASDASQPKNFVPTRSGHLVKRIPKFIQTVNMCQVLAFEPLMWCK